MKRNVIPGRFMDSKGRDRLYKKANAAPKLYTGPSVEGKPMKLVEVVSGNVVDRKPSFV